MSKWYIKHGSRVNDLLDDIKESTAFITANGRYDHNCFCRSVRSKSEEDQILIFKCCFFEKEKWNQRDRPVFKILDDDVRQWRKESRCTQQSKVEKAFYRY